MDLWTGFFLEVLRRCRLSRGLRLERVEENEGFGGNGQAETRARDLLLIDSDHQRSSCRRISIAEFRRQFGASAQDSRRGVRRRFSSPRTGGGNKPKSNPEARMVKKRGPETVVLLAGRQRRSLPSMEPRKRVCSGSRRARQGLPPPVFPAGQQNVPMAEKTNGVTLKNEKKKKAGFQAAFFRSGGIGIQRAQPRKVCLPDNFLGVWPPGAEKTHSNSPTFFQPNGITHSLPQSKVLLAVCHAPPADPRKR